MEIIFKESLTSVGIVNAECVRNEVAARVLIGLLDVFVVLILAHLALEAVRTLIDLLARLFVLVRLLGLVRLLALAVGGGWARTRVLLLRVRVRLVGLLTHELAHVAHGADRARGHLVPILALLLPV